jgi:hypothetical protein
MPIPLGEDMPGTPSCPLTKLPASDFGANTTGLICNDNLTELAPLDFGVKVVRPR